MSRIDSIFSHFWTRGKVWNHLWQGTEFTGVDGHASGDTVTVAVSNSVVGAAHGAASTTARLLSVDVNEFPGTAHVGTVAPGATVASTVSITAGAPSGAGGASGDTLTANASANAGSAHGGATAPGHGVDVNWSVSISGAAHSSSATPAALLSLSTSMVVSAFAATGNASVSGRLLPTVFVNVNSGHTRGDAFFTNTLFRPGLSFWEGSATGGTGHEATGQIIRVNVVMVVEGDSNGIAHGGANSEGDTVAAVASIVPGTASELHIDAEASGAVLVVQVSLEAGTAVGGEEGDGFAFGENIEVDASIADAGLASGDAVAPADAVQVVASVIAGSTGIDDIAFGRMLGLTATLFPGQAFGDKQPAPNTVGGAYSTSKTKTKKVNAIAHGAVITAATNIRSGHAFGTYSFAILSRKGEPPLTAPAVLELLPGEFARKAVVSGGLVVASSDVVSGRASGHASARGSVIEGVMPYGGDEDELMMEDL